MTAAAKLTESGIVDLSRDGYDRLARVNWTSLKRLLKSPAHYRDGLVRPEPDSDAKRFGRVAHLAVLEPERFATECAVWRGGVRRGKAWDAFGEANEGRELLTEAEYDRCLALQAAVRADKRAMRYLARGSAEVSVLWEHVVAADGELPRTVLQCKGRLDFLADPPAIADLKTTKNASPDGFASEAHRYRYATQAAMYVDGVEAATGKRLPFVLIAVEKEPPHVVQVYSIPESILAEGREEYRYLLGRLAECRHANDWPGYIEGEQELQLPRWARQDDDEDVSDLGLAFGDSAETEA